MKESKPRILIVDDEENNLNSFKSCFRRHYKIFAAVHVDDAFKILEKEDIEIVLTDQRMPKISGVEFLEQVVEKYPHTIRMLLTGFDDFKPAIQAVNQGAIYKYISKPWNEDELKNTIDNAVETYRNRMLLQKRNQELKKAYNELDSFVYRASHDIRGPLMSILGITNLAKLEGANEEMTNYFNLIEKSIHQLDVFVRNMVDYSRNSRLEDRYEHISLSIMLKEVLEHLAFVEPRSTQLNVMQKIEGDDEVYTDRDRLKIIVQNLLSNAVRFQREGVQGEVSIHIQNTKNELLIEVEDNGIGIKPSQFESIFDIFYRGSDMSQGSGIGLYVCREAVSKLNGEIKVDSTVGTGSIFNVNLPHPSEK